MVTCGIKLIEVQFCHVNSIGPAVHGMPCVTSGTQKWNAESPTFVTRAIVMRVDAAGLKMFVIHCVPWPEYIRLMIIAIISSIDVVDCFRKYLLDASITYGFMFLLEWGHH